MKSFLTLPTLLSFALAAVPLARPYLDPSIPIYIGDIFWPPSMIFIAWLPTSILNPLDWCMKATEAPLDGLFSLSGVDALQIKDYFSEHAYITRAGERFAECYVTPESVKMGSCQGSKDRDCEGGHKYTGPGNRKWTCWIGPRKWDWNGTERSSMLIEAGERLTDSKARPTNVVTGMAAATRILGVFTPGVTGM